MVRTQKQVPAALFINEAGSIGGEGRGRGTGFYNSPSVPLAPVHLPVLFSAELDAIAG